MIKTTVKRVREAYIGLSNINSGVKLRQKAAWRVARLLGKMKSIVEADEKTRNKLYIDVDAVQITGGWSIMAPEKKEGESPEAWTRRVEEHKQKLKKLREDLESQDEQEVEIDYDLLPLSLFVDEDQAREKENRYSANDLSLALEFFQDDTGA